MSTRGDQKLILLYFVFLALVSKTSVALSSAKAQYLQNSAENGERSVLTLDSLCLPCSVRDTARSYKKNNFMITPPTLVYLIFQDRIKDSNHKSFYPLIVTKLRNWRTVRLKLCDSLYYVTKHSAFFIQIVNENIININIRYSQLGMFLIVLMASFIYT